MYLTVYSGESLVSPYHLFGICFRFISTLSNLSERDFAVRNDALLSRLPVAVIKSWYQREGYIKSMADLIAKELDTFSEPAEVGLILSLWFEMFVNAIACEVEF